MTSAREASRRMHWAVQVGAPHQNLDRGPVWTLEFPLGISPLHLLHPTRRRSGTRALEGRPCPSIRPLDDHGDQPFVQNVWSRERYGTKRFAVQNVWKVQKIRAKRFASKRYDKRLNVKWPFSPETQTFCPKQNVWVRKIECKVWPKIKTV